MKKGQKEAFLIKYYNELKELNYYKENSFYWLQYSIACMNIGKYDLAQTYLDNAYSWFRDSEEIVPFQIDTQQAKLNLTVIEKGGAVDIKGKFLEAHDLLMKPVVSVKDNPVKQITNFKYYMKKGVKDKMIKEGYIKEYQKCCGEAYNKTNQYLKNVLVEADKRELQNLAQNLLRNSVG